MTRTKSAFLTLLVLLSPIVANADVYEITAEGVDGYSEYATDFTIVYDDTSGDGLFQVDELLSFSGFSLFADVGLSEWYLCEEVAPDIVHGSPDLPGISTASGAGTSGTNGYTAWIVEIVIANCGFGPGASGFGFNYWTYSVRNISTPEPAVLLEQLETTVAGFGPGSSFANKIMLAQAYLDVPDEESACSVLGAFLNQVRAQRGKKLTEEQANQFTADAVAIMDAVGCD